jgi:hypothetical protein
MNRSRITKEQIFGTSLGFELDVPVQEAETVPSVAISP